MALHLHARGFDPVHNVNLAFAHTCIPAHWRERQEEKFKVIHSYLDEFKAILGYLRQKQSFVAPLWAPVSFNTRTLDRILFGAPPGLCMCSQDSFIG